MQKAINGVLGLLMLLGIMAVSPSVMQAQECSDKLFSVTMDDSLKISDAVKNLAETCGLTILVKDSGAKHRLEQSLYYVKLKNTTLRGFLDIILSENDLSYDLRGNTLSIAYLVTRTFKVHYISGQRSGKSNAHVTIANATNSSAASGSGSKTGISITSDDAFKFWTSIKEEVHKILVSAGDGGTHYTKVGEAWVGPDGQKWEYNPLEPIVDPEAGMITVTGTSRQIKRVSRYIASLAKQIKQQVLIDVRILTVTFDNTHTTGIDWSQLYGLQNFVVDAIGMTEHNVNKITNGDDGMRIKEWTSGRDPNNDVSATQIQAHATIKDVVRFLKTNGDVRSVSSPRVMTLNNQPALISVGKELFYKLKSSSQSSQGGSTSTSEGEKIDSVFAGILLDITPEIDARGMITLKINPSVTETLSPVTNDGARSMPPDLVRRQIASVIKVRDGNHAILGGLISTKTGKKVSKVPLLGDIPLLEYAFKREEKIEKTEELVIIITPHIINGKKSVSLHDLGYTRLK
jgi:general secretion pathway protein D